MLSIQTREEGKGNDDPDEYSKEVAPLFPRALFRHQRRLRIWKEGSYPLFKFLV
jgi:hypothetical protein